MIPVLLALVFFFYLSYRSFEKAEDPMGTVLSIMAFAVFVFGWGVASEVLRPDEGRVVKEMLLHSLKMEKEEEAWRGSDMQVYRYFSERPEGGVVGGAVPVRQSVLYAETEKRPRMLTRKFGGIGWFFLHLGARDPQYEFYLSPSEMEAFFAASEFGDTSKVELFSAERVE